MVEEIGQNGVLVIGEDTLQVHFLQRTVCQTVKDVGTGLRVHHHIRHVQIPKGIQRPERILVDALDDAHGQVKGLKVKVSQRLEEL